MKQLVLLLWNFSFTSKFRSYRNDNKYTNCYTTEFHYPRIFTKAICDHLYEIIAKNRNF